MKWNSSVTAWIHNKWHHAVAWSVDVNRLWKPSQTAVSNAEFSRIPTALCHLLLSLHITTACVHCCLDTAQPQPQELEIVNKKRRAVLTSQSWPAPNGQLIVVESLWELVALLQQQTTERDKKRKQRRQFRAWKPPKRRCRKLKKPPSGSDGQLIKLRREIWILAKPQTFEHTASVGGGCFLRFPLRLKQHH